MQLVIFHGSFTNVHTHWFPGFLQEMTQLGHNVLVPQFPVNSFDDVMPATDADFTPKQSLSSWLNTFENEVLPNLEKNTLWIGHSLGNLFMLHVLEKHPEIALVGAIFVVPFYKEVNKGLPHPYQFDVVNNTFYRDSFDFPKLIPQLNFSYTLYSLNDPYVPNTDSLDFAYQLDSTVIPIKNGKHLGSHLEKFPLVEELAKSMIDYSQEANLVVNVE